MKLKERVNTNSNIISVIIILIGVVVGALTSIKITINNQYKFIGSEITLTGLQMNSGIIDNDYRFFQGEQIIRLISSGDNFIIKGGVTDYIGEQYPKIIIKTGNIEKAVLRIVVDLKDSWVQKNGGYVYGYSVSYENGKQIRKPAPGYRFSLKFGFGNVRKGDVEYGGWYDVANYGISPSNRYNNNDDFGLNGALPGKDIIGGREYIIYLDEVNVGYQPRKNDNDPIVKPIYPLDYLKKNLNKPIPVSAWLSDAGIRGTVIKEMEIIYVGGSGAIQKY